MGGEDSVAGLLERTTTEARIATARPEQSVPVGADAGIMAIMSTTRAMRHLAPDPVPVGLLRSVIEAATWAPSAGNWQMASYVVVTDREVMTRLAVLWRRVVEDWRLYLEGAGAVGSGSSAATTRASIDYQLDHFAETPALIVVCGDLRGKAGETRSTAATFRFLVRRVGLRRTLALARGLLRMSARSEGASVYPAVENLLLAARAHGLAACLTTWHLLAEDEFKEVLGIPRDVKTWAVIPIGWPLRRFGPVQRRPVDDVIHHEHW